jgi:hypothetical protein
VWMKYIDPHRVWMKYIDPHSELHQMCYCSRICIAALSC